MTGSNLTFEMLSLLSLTFEMLFGLFSRVSFQAISNIVGGL